MPPLPLPSPPLTNGGVSLRAWLVEDAPALEAACADPDIPRFTTVPATYSTSAAREWVARQDDNRESGESIVLAITERGEECPLGTVGLGRLLDSAGGAELGYWLMPEARGRGLAARAARLLVDWGFAELRLRRLELATRPENRASQRVAVRLGFRREACAASTASTRASAWT